MRRAGSLEERAWLVAAPASPKHRRPACGHATGAIRTARVARTANNFEHRKGRFLPGRAPRTWLSRPPVARPYGPRLAVLIDVTVLDRTGQAVLDLKPEEFELSEDGKAQRIVSATLVHGAGSQPASAGDAAVQPNTPAAGATTPASAASPGPAEQQGPVVTAILFDRLSSEARPLAHQAALAYVATLAPSADYAGVFLADLKLTTFQPLRRNRRIFAARSIEWRARHPATCRLKQSDRAIGPTRAVWIRVCRSPLVQSMRTTT